jgi:drug/metabolite transporter (DMT)-like permease
LSFASIGAFNTILYWSLQHTTAINATLMQSSGPLLIALWSLVLFRDPLTPGQIGGILASLAGVLAIVSGGDAMRLAQLTLNVGDVAVIVAIAIYALYSTLLRKRPGMSPVSFAAVTMGLGAVMILPFAAAERLAGARLAPLDLGAVAALVYVVVFPSVLAVLFFNRGVQLIGANRAGPFFHLVPLFGSILAVVFLGERFGLHHGIGAFLVVAGVVLASRSPSERRKRMAEAPPRS